MSNEEAFNLYMNNKTVDYLRFDCDGLLNMDSSDVRAAAKEALDQCS